VTTFACPNSAILYVTFVAKGHSNVGKEHSQKDKIMNTPSRSLILCSILALAACGQASIEGEYSATGGQVGIYELNSMVVTQEEGRENYTVQFIGDEETLSYENVVRDGTVLSVNDKGFIFTVEFNGDEAVVGDGEATFEKNPD